MKSKNLIFLVFFLVASAIYSQNESSKFKVDTGTLSYDISAENIDELRNFDWDFILESFKNNPPNKPISLSFEYNKESKLGETKIDSFSFKVSGKSSEAEEIVDKSKSIITEFISKN
ncbi:hypothetical protein [Namhaeicola litoreus]|uniref:Uncharacterized protein n=1 Tax=Namhaeicola litoreus TaxID=1052145 RepID=A0ABW3XYE2_9FLAO